MASEHIEPKEALASVETDSPSSARRNVAGIFQTVADADAGLFCKCGIGEDGRYYTTIEAVGSEAICNMFDREESGPPAERPGWDPEDPPQESLKTFRASSAGAGGQPSESPCRGFLGELWPTEGVRHEATALLYDGSTFLGCIAVFRTEDRPFEEEKLRELNALVDAGIDVLARAENRERQLVGDQPAMVLLQPDNLEVACATENGAKWLNDRRERALEEALEEVSDDESFPTELNVDGFRVWLNKMTGPAEERFISKIECPQNPELSVESVLTPRQREVVGYAAAGATNREIAETLGISSDTVSDHLSESYRRLGVANRVELARKVADSK